MSGWVDSKYSITLNSRGQILYGSGVLPGVDININCNLTVNTIKITSAQISIDSNSEALFFARTIETVSASISVGSVTVFVATEILQPSVQIQIDSNLTVDSLKIALASSSIQIDSELAIVGKEFLKASIEILPNCSVDVLTTRVQLIQSDILIGSNIDASSEKIALASSQIDIESYKLTLAEEIVFAKIQLNIESDLTSSVKKEAFALSTLSIEADVITDALEIVHVSSTISITSALTCTATEVLLASCEINGLVVKVTIGKEIQLGKAEIFVISKLLSIPAIRFSPSIIEDTQSIRPLLIIDGKPLTEHNRTIDISFADQFVENINWASTRNRYYKKKKARKQFNVSWTFVPNSREKTVDQKHGRDTIRSIGSNPRSMSLKFLNIDSDGSNSYTETSHDVVVTSYNESLIRRDIDDDTYYWDCNLSFEEI